VAGFQVSISGRFWVSTEEYGEHLFVIDGGRIAYETSDASEISAELIERVFRVRATRLGEDGHATWRFSL